MVEENKDTHRIKKVSSRNCQRKQVTYNILLKKVHTWPPKDFEGDGALVCSSLTLEQTPSIFFSEFRAAKFKVLI